MPSQVLIVDDDPMLQRLLGAHLSTAGYQVIETSSGEAGLAALRKLGPRIAFVDYDMPGMNGIEFCRQARANTQIPFAHLVILTAHVDRALTIAALDAGANDFMTKPFHRGELLARLRAGERTVRLHDEAANAIRLESERNHLHNAVTVLEQVLSVVAHDLREPIASLANTSAYLSNPANRGNKEWETVLNRMNEEVGRLSVKVNELMDDVRMNSGQAGWSKFALEPLCNQVIQEIHPLVASRQISVSARVDPTSTEMTGDPAAVRRLLLNLLSNACKFTTTGSIRIETKTDVRDGHEWVDLKITDTGSGISADVLNQIAKPLTLGAGNIGVNAPVSSRGLGLAVCKRIVELHGGRMSITSTVGQGTCIHVVMRSDLTQPAPPENRASLAPASNTQAAPLPAAQP